MNRIKPLKTACISPRFVLWYSPRAIDSAGRVPPSHGGSQGFESLIAHHSKPKPNCRYSSVFRLWVSGRAFMGAKIHIKRWGRVANGLGIDWWSRPLARKGRIFGVVHKNLVPPLPTKSQFEEPFFDCRGRVFHLFRTGQTQSMGDTKVVFLAWLSWHLIQKRFSAKNNTNSDFSEFVLLAGGGNNRARLSHERSEGCSVTGIAKQDRHRWETCRFLNAQQCKISARFARQKSALSLPRGIRTTRHNLTRATHVSFLCA